jgi:hypothetical protein
MRIIDLSLEELGGLICKTLSEHGIDAVLSGGSWVSVWTDNEYSSHDMDMITTTLASHYQLTNALESLGFQRRGKSRYYEHPDTEFALEFPSGPVMVGDEQVTEDRIHNLRTRAGTLRLLSPTDCIKDRLSAFYHWKDRQSWEQAVSIGKRHELDWTDLKNWHSNEGEAASFDKFREAVKA